MSCGAGGRGGLDLVLLWLWQRLAATAPIGPLAWEPPYATGAALEKTKKKKRKKLKQLKWPSLENVLNKCCYPVHSIEMLQLARMR